MLFDSRAADSAVVVGAGHDWQPTRAAIAGHRSAAGFLTLPELPVGIPVEAEYRRRESGSFNELVLAQFKHGPLRAADVNNPVDSGDAFQQAFFAWIRRQLLPRKRMNFSPCLLDSNAVQDAIEYLDNREEFEDTAPLYLAMEIEDETLYTFGDSVQQLVESHPLLVHTMIHLIDIAGFRTCWVRSPSWYLYEFANTHWEGDESATDEEILKFFDGNGEDVNSADIQRYLPSNVRPELYADEHRRPERIPGRRHRSSSLSEHELLGLRKKCRGLPRLVCTELIYISRLLKRLGTRSAFSGAFYTNPVYSACMVVFESTDLIGEIIDDHFNHVMQAADYSTFGGFEPLASTRIEIRRQYRNWEIGFQIIRHLDRLLALVTQPFYGD